MNFEALAKIILKNLGYDPEIVRPQIETAISKFKTQVDDVDKRLHNQERLLKAIAEKLGVQLPAQEINNERSGIPQQRPDTIDGTSEAA